MSRKTKVQLQKCNAKACNLLHFMRKQCAKVHKKCAKIAQILCKRYVNFVKPYHGIMSA